MQTVTTKISRDILGKAIGLASKAIMPNPIIPLLSNMLFESANGSSRVTGTNFEVGISVSFPTDGEEFKTCIPAKTFVSLIDVLSSEEVEMKLNVQDQSAIVMTDSSTASIKCAPADEFPDVPRVTKSQVTMPVDQFKEMVQRVAFASSNSTEGVLSGVHIMTDGKKIIMFATDGYHVSYEDFTLKKDAATLDVIIKGETLEMISRVLPDEGDLKIQASENKIMFHSGKIDIVSQLLSGNFPDHKLVKKSIGKASTSITISTIDLFRACRQLKIFTSDKDSGSTKLDVNGMIVRYSITTAEKGDADVTLSVAKEGKDISIGINVHLLYQFLEICKTQQVKIEFSTNQAPILLTMEGYKNFYHVIMPVVL